MEHSKEKLIFTLSGFVIGALLTGFFVQLFVVQNLQLKNTRLTSAVNDIAPVQDQALSVSGTVTRVDGEVIFLEVDQSQFPSEEVPNLRRVLVRNTTELVRYEEKDLDTFLQEEQEYQQELAEFEAQRAEPDEESTTVNDLQAPVPPDILREVRVSLGDIKPGDTIQASATENIKQKEEFEAARIVLESPSLPVVGASADSENENS